MTAVPTPASLRHLPERRAADAPTGVCLADDRRSLDNRAFAELVGGAAAALRRAGVGRGDIVAAMLPNRLELVVAMFAAWRLGAALTPINPALTEAEARHQVDDSGAEAVIGDAGHPLTTLPVDGLASTGGGPVTVAGSEGADGDLALVIYTSGTTGVPKGVMLDHANLEAMCAQVVAGLRLGADDHSLLILPLFHVNGIVVSVLSPLLAGGRTTIAGAFSPSTFFDTVARVRPTYFSAVPAVYAMLSALPAEVEPDTTSLRHAICGAAPMPAELIERFEARYGVTIIEGYGLSEGTCASTINPIDGPRKPGTVGVALPGQTVAVMAPDGTLVDDGSPGEVVINGPNVMRGYLGRPEATADTIVDGWLHTGDVGRFDDDGYLVLVDRIKDMIIRGGENLYPKEIENALHAHPAVLEAAVVGAPDPVLGEVPVAHVALRPGEEISAAELLEHCSGRLARMKVPTEIVVEAVLPKNPVGKIDKPLLRSQHD
ncbi:MAG: class I adenylate-forming enzyme family protein [Acidimicrobiales bacterium]